MYITRISFSNFFLEITVRGYIFDINKFVSYIIHIPLNAFNLLRTFVIISLVSNT